MKTDEAIRVLMVGNRCATLGIGSALNDYVGIDVIGETESSDEAVVMAGEVSPDMILVLMDSLNSEMDVNGITRAITGKRPWVRVVFITRNVIQYLPLALKTGAAGVLSPGHSPSELPAALRRIRQWAPYSLTTP